MQIVLNSKFFSGLSVPELGDKALELGYDGIDVCVRPGHPVHPGNAAAELPGAVAAWARQGLVLPAGDRGHGLRRSGAPGAESLYAACAEAGVPRLKIGFWRFAPGRRLLAGRRCGAQGFGGVRQAQREARRADLLPGPQRGLHRLELRRADAPDPGVRPAPRRRLSRSRPPRPRRRGLGDGAGDGPRPPLGGGGQGRHVPPRAGEEAPLEPCFVKVGEGCVDWDRCLGILSGFGFDGPLTVHTEYRFDEAIIRQVGWAESSPPNLEEWARADAAYLRKALAALRPSTGGKQ